MQGAPDTDFLLACEVYEHVLLLSTAGVRLCKFARVCVTCVRCSGVGGLLANRPPRSATLSQHMHRAPRLST